MLTQQQHQSSNRNYIIGYQQQMQRRTNQILTKYYGPNSRIWHMITQNINQNKQILIYQKQTQQIRKQQNQQTNTITNTQINDKNKYKIQQIQNIKIQQMISYLQQTGLKLKYDQNNYNDIQQLYVLVKYYLQYPIQRLAIKHIRANSFNRFDIDKLQIQEQGRGQGQQGEKILNGYQNINNNNSLNHQQNSQGNPYQIQNVNQFNTNPTNTNIPVQTQIQNPTNNPSSPNLNPNSNPSPLYPTYIPQICQCCSLPIPQKILSQYPIPTWIFSDLKHIGISTRLFFHTQFTLGIMLLIMFFIFCLYAIVTNFKATMSYLSQLSLYDQTLKFIQQITYQGISAYSPGSLINNQSIQNKNKYQSQKILGYITLFLLIVIFFISKLWQRKQMKLTIQKYNRAQTYTLLFNNLPANISAQHLQNLLNQYLYRVLDKQHDKINTIKQHTHKLKQQQLYKFNNVFEQLKNDKNIGNMSYINIFYKINSKWKDNYQKYLMRNLNLGIIEKINKASLLFIKQQEKIEQIIKCQGNMFQLRRYFQKLVGNRQRSYTFNQLHTQQSYRYNKYQQYRKQRYRLQQLKINKNTQLLQQRQQQLDTMPTFVTFTNRWLLQQFYLCHKKQPFTYIISPSSSQQNNNNSNKYIKADIQQSPSPQDIIWSNIGQSPVSLAIKFIINLILTFLISILSLIILYLLTLQKQDFQNMANNWYYVSYLMIPIIIGFKYLIRKIIYSLTRRQYCWTNSHQQASIVFKSNLILIFQSTFIPSAISSIGTANLLGQRGLSQISFYLSFVNVLVIIISKVIDPFDTIYKIYRVVRPYNRIEYTQKEYNQIKLNMEKKQYNISSQYLQIVDTFVFTCAFVPYQPWVVLPGIIHFWYITMYRKYYMIKYCKRPIPDSKIIQDVAMLFIIMGPAQFVFMTYVISNQGNYQFSGGVSLAIIIGFFVGFFILYGMCTIRIFKETQGAEKIYYQDYVNQITIDYDMKNPATTANRVEKSRRNYINNLGKINNILI